MALVTLTEELIPAFEEAVGQERAWHTDKRAAEMGVTPEFAAGFRAGLEQACGTLALVVASLAVDSDDIEG